VPDTTTATARFDRPAGEVFEQLADPAELGALSHAFDRVETREDGPLRVGSHATAEVRVDGVPSALELEVTELEPPSRLAFRGSSEELRTWAGFDVVDDDEGCEVTATTETYLAEVGEGADPASSPAFADLGSSLLEGLRTSLGTG
jgi:uncharacterized protein YndB with AHSA1/START domain